MPGIGKVTEPELLSLGIVTIGDLQQMGQEKLRARFGKFGEWLYTKSCGRDIEAYQYEEEPKSISHETTFDTNIAMRRKWSERSLILRNWSAGACATTALRAHGGAEDPLCPVSNRDAGRHARRTHQSRLGDLFKRTAAAGKRVGRPKRKFGWWECGPRISGAPFFSAA